MSISENIKKFRKNNNITQKELAKKLNVTIRTIQNYESGNREPNINTLKSISNILNIKLSDLLHDESLEKDIYVNTNKKYYEKLSNEELINLLNCDDINKKKLESILEEEKEAFLKDLSRVIPLEYKLQHHINNFDNLNKDDLILLTKEFFSYGENLLNTFIEIEYTPKIKELLNKLNKSYEIIKEQENLIADQKKIIEEYSNKLNIIVNTINDI